MQKLASALAKLEKGDASEIVTFSPPETFECSEECGKKAKGERFEKPGDLSGGTAVRCSDGEVVEDGLDELREHYERMLGLSEFADG